jgi:hypothetical protein
MDLLTESGGPINGASAAIGLLTTGGIFTQSTMMCLQKLIVD